MGGLDNRCGRSSRRVSVLLGGCLLLATGYALAAIPIITFDPQTPTTLSLAPGDTATVQYVVMNQSHKSHSFQMQTIQGVAVDTGAGHCPSPFTLAFKQSCLLSLEVVGSELAGDVNGGPVVCVDANQFQCYQPASVNQLAITLTDPPPVATIEASPATISVPIGEPATVTVTNAAASPFAATGLAVYRPAASSILYNIGSCASAVAPGASCTFQFGGPVVETNATLTIVGDNTTTARIVVSIVDDQTIFRDGFDDVSP